MSITVRCDCGKKLIAKDTLAGKRVKCPGCGLAIAVPLVGNPLALTDALATKTTAEGTNKPHLPLIANDYRTPVPVHWMWWAGAAAVGVTLFLVGLGAGFLLGRGGRHTAVSQAVDRMPEAGDTGQPQEGSNQFAQRPKEAAAAPANQGRIKGDGDQAARHPRSLPGAKGLRFEKVGRSPPNMEIKEVFISDGDPSKSDPLMEKSHNVQLFPSGITELRFGVLFSGRPPEGTRITFDIFNAAGPLKLAMSGYLTNEVARYGEVISTCIELPLHPETGNYGNGDYLAEARINGDLIGRLNWSIGPVLAATNSGATVASAPPEPSRSGKLESSRNLPTDQLVDPKLADFAGVWHGKLGDWTVGKLIIRANGSGEYEIAGMPNTPPGKPVTIAFYGPGYFVYQDQNKDFRIHLQEFPDVIEFLLQVTRDRQKLTFLDSSKKVVGILTAKEQPTTPTITPPLPPTPHFTETNRFATGHTQAIDQLVLSHDGRIALSGSYNNAIKEPIVQLWDTAGGKELRRFAGHQPSSVQAIALTPDGRRAFSADSGTMRVWDVDSGKELRSFRGRFMRASFSLDCRRVLTPDYVRSELWDIDRGRKVRTFEGHEGQVNCVALSQDGRRALSGGGFNALTSIMDYTVRLWDVEAGRELRQFKGHKAPLKCVAFSPDGRQALSGDWDGVVRLWDLDAGREVRSLQGHPGSIAHVAFLPGGRFAMSSSGDKSVVNFAPGQAISVDFVKKSSLAILWDLETGQQVQRFEEAAPSRFNDFAVSADGQRILFSYKDNLLALWGSADQPANEARPKNSGQAEKPFDKPAKGPNGP